MERKKVITARKTINTLITTIKIIKETIIIAITLKRNTDTIRDIKCYFKLYYYYYKLKYIAAIYLYKKTDTKK